MQNHVTWASPDDSLKQILAKMQQTDAEDQKAHVLVESTAADWTI
jgi:hypothetical protein